MKKIAALALTAAFLAAPTVSFANAFDGDESVIIFDRAVPHTYKADNDDGRALDQFKHRGGVSLEQRYDISE